MSQPVDDLVTKVAAMHTVVDGAIALLGTLSSLIRATAGDAGKVNALAAEIDAKKATLAQAIVDNTPVASP